MFEIIPYIATPIALIAFLIAVAANTYRARSKQDLELVKSVPETDRAAVIGRLWEKEGLDKYDPDNLTREQRYNLLMTTLQQRVTKMRILAVVSILITIILATLIGSIILTDQTSVLPENGPAAIPTVGPPPVIVELIGSYGAEEPDVYTIESNTSWTTEAAEELIRLAELRIVLLEDDKPAYEARFIIRNSSSENISLTISPSFFRLEDNQGLVANQLYFCCSANGVVLAPDQEREVRIFFEDLWTGGKYEPPALSPSVQLIVRGLAPVTRAAWSVPLLLTAD